jgi:hypothetical protein
VLEASMLRDVCIHRVSLLCGKLFGVAECGLSPRRTPMSCDEAEAFAPIEIFWHKDGADAYRTGESAAPCFVDTDKESHSLIIAEAAHARPRSC